MGHGRKQLPHRSSEGLKGVSREFTCRLTVFWRLGGGSASGTTPDMGSAAPPAPTLLFSMCAWCRLAEVPTFMSGRSAPVYDWCCAWFCVGKRQRIVKQQCHRAGRESLRECITH